MKSKSTKRIFPVWGRLNLKTKIMGCYNGLANYLAIRDMFKVAIKTCICKYRIDSLKFKLHMNYL